MFFIPPELRSAVLNRCGIKGGMKVLDVGCGTGYFSRFLAGGAEIKVMGIDREELFIREAGSLAEEAGLSDRVSFVLGDALALPFKDDSFDAVVSHTFFTSVFDPAAAMREMRRVCRPDGHISSVTSMSYTPQASHPGRHSPEETWRAELSALDEKAWKMYEALDPLAGYQSGLDTSDLPAFFTDSGLGDVEIFPLGRAFSLSDASVTVMEKRLYIERMQAARVDKANRFMGLGKSKYYMSANEHARYIALLELEGDELLKHLGENLVWQWDGGASLLVSGLNLPEEKNRNGGYSKHKDATPEETLRRIKGILKEMEIETELTWIDSRVAGCCSNRVTVKGTPVGANGKGTNRLYAETSAYAELLERLQNDMYYFGAYSPEDQWYRGVRQTPDEILLSFDEILARGGDYLEFFFSRMGASGYLARMRMLEDCNYIAATPGKTEMIPFLNVRTQEPEYLPLNVLLALYGSNGMCAGNTMEEALVQGLAEVFERHVTRVLLREKITPPDVNDSVLAQFGPLWDIIRSLRQNGRYAVTVKDCSLGRGYPVMGTIIHDRETGRFGMKLGAHPSMRIALERTLTEAFQGQSLEQFTAHNMIGSDEDVYGRENELNIFKIGIGFYPPELLGDKPSYPFRMFADVSGRSNEEMLRGMIGVLFRDGIDLYIRDVSFFGFPSYFIVAPGVTELYPLDPLRFREELSLHRIFVSAGKMRELTDDEVERLARYTCMKIGSLLENNTLWILGRPFSREYPGQEQGGLYLLCLSLCRLGRYKDALYAAKSMSSDSEYVRCIRQLLAMRAANMPERSIRQSLPKLFRDDIAGRVTAQFLEGDIFQNTYPETTCWDCGRCPSADLCSYKEVAMLRRKIQDRVIEAGLSQETIRQSLKKVMEARV